MAVVPYPAGGDSAAGAFRSSGKPGLTPSPPGTTGPRLPAVPPSPRPRPEAHVADLAVGHRRAVLARDAEFHSRLRTADANLRVLGWRVERRAGADAGLRAGVPDGEGRAEPSACLAHERGCRGSTA